MAELLDQARRTGDARRAVQRRGVETGRMTHAQRILVQIPGPYSRLKLSRLSDLDLLLSKLMRDDPQDRQDALFIVRTAGLDFPRIEAALQDARLPDSPEIREQFAAASRYLFDALRAAT
jgi:hypothetical protein